MSRKDRKQAPEEQEKETVVPEEAPAEEQAPEEAAEAAEPEAADETEKQLEAANAKAAGPSSNWSLEVDYEADTCCRRRRGHT